MNFPLRIACDNDSLCVQKRIGCCKLRAISHHNLQLANQQWVSVCKRQKLTYLLQCIESTGMQMSSVTLKTTCMADCNTCLHGFEHPLGTQGLWHLELIATVSQRVSEHKSKPFAAAKYVTSKFM